MSKPLNEMTESELEETFLRMPYFWLWAGWEREVVVARRLAARGLITMELDLESDQQASFWDCTAVGNPGAKPH